MIAGVSAAVWTVVVAAVLLNAGVCLMINIVAARRAYKRGYEAAQISIEAIALGRLMEQHKGAYEAAKMGIRERRGL